MPLSAFAAVPLLASLLLSYRAGPGTVYVAADSRLTPAENPETSQPTAPADTACKLRVLRDGVVFAGSGNVVFSTPTARTDIYAVAASVAAALPRRPLNAGDIRGVALAWQAQVYARMSAKLAIGRRRQPGAALPAAGSTGSFYGALGDGSVYGITVRVGTDADGVLRQIEEPQLLAGYLVAAGTDEAKREALAIAEAEQNPARPAAAAPWPLRLRQIEAQTIRLETQRYGMNSEIGGPIDEVAITAKGPTWLARKPTCR